MKTKFGLIIVLFLISFGASMGQQVFKENGQNQGYTLNKPSYTITLGEFSAPEKLSVYGSKNKGIIGLYDYNGFSVAKIFGVRGWTVLGGSFDSTTTGNLSVKYSKGWMYFKGTVKATAFTGTSYIGTSFSGTTGLVTNMKSTTDTITSAVVQYLVLTAITDTTTKRVGLFRVGNSVFVGNGSSYLLLH